MSFAKKLADRVLEISKKTTEHVIEFDPAIRKSRLDICDSCPELFKPTFTCKQCGCFMQAKTKLKSAVCPLGKW